MGGPLSTLCLYLLPLRYANMLIANYKERLGKSDPDALPQFEALERKHHTGVSECRGIYVISWRLKAHYVPLTHSGS